MGLGSSSLLGAQQIRAPHSGTAESTPYRTPGAPLLGAAWYPEQWPEARWQSDVALMQQAHFSVVRVGEFAWSSMEPSEGHYNFTWLDRAIALAAQHHMAVVLGTPTDAPPAWLTQKYPETLRVDASGHRDKHGMRRQFNYANPLYRKLCAGIVTEMARRYGHNADVIGWQIGNEYTDESFDPATRAQFQQFVREQYKTLDNLNARWTTAYWSQTYSDWSQIPLPTGGGNPGLLLAHKHFVTTTWRSFQRNQIDALRPLIDARQFITTNIGGLAWSDNWDHYAISADLDLASWDDYVGSGHLDAAKNAMLDDFVRGWKRQNFWIMETQPGFVNWSPLNNALDPGETSTVAWQGVGHGADAVLYWQWAPALNGQEQYHGSLVGPDGQPLPLFAEIAKLGENFERVRAAVANTAPHAEIALLHTYDSRWAIDFQLHNRNYDQEKVLLRFYEPLWHVAQAHGESVDIIDPTRAPLQQYKLLVAPSLNIIDDALATKLIAWVQSGGTLVLGPRSGMKDEDDALDPHRQPGPLEQAAGVQVEQFYALDHPVSLMQRPEGRSDTWLQGSADTWAEVLRMTSPGTRELLHYAAAGTVLGEAPAWVARSVGKGTIEYLGTLPDAALLQRLLGDPLPQQTIVASDFLAPMIPARAQPIEVAVRAPVQGSSGQKLFVVINHSDAPAKTMLHGHMRSLLAAQPTIDRDQLQPGQQLGNLGAGSLWYQRGTSEVDLPAYGVAVLVDDAAGETR